MPDETAPQQPDGPDDAGDESKRWPTREQILCTKVPPVVVELEGWGQVSLRGATLRDLAFLTELVQREDDPRAFAEAVVRHQWMGGDPRSEILAGMTDEHLMRLVGAWAVNGLSLDPEKLTDLPSVRAAIQADVDRREAEMRAVLAHIKLPDFGAIRLPELPVINLSPGVLAGTQTVGESVQRLSDLIQPHLDTLARQMAVQFRVMEEVRASFIPPPQLTRIFSSLPSPERWREIFEGLCEGKDTLDELGYGFTVDKWEVSFIRQIGRGDYGRRELHDAFREHTRTPEFSEQLCKVFDRTPRLRRRWRIVGPALGAHVRREYALSIPALLTQLEGIVTDLLILRGQATFRGKDLLAKEAGMLKRQARDRTKPVVLSGLDAKLQHSGYKSMEEVRGGAEFMLNRLVRPRNAILHGSRTSYMSAKLSVQLLLLIGIYTEVVAAVESGEISAMTDL
ncbi:hypothetical protein BH23GEM3_BH23GEM3_12150 [soil metagenome]|nr:hypothetical protein [Gemmatimonadota bacterium]